jgi:hypothetical protein
MARWSDFCRGLARMFPKIMNSPYSRWVVPVLAACAIVACGDQMATAPYSAGGPAATLASESTAGVVQILKRTRPLADNYTASSVIGPRGGQLLIGPAGVRVDFARGAVTTPTRITVTALKGSSVAYKFQPHGLVFKAPVTVRQSLRHTVAWKNPALAAELQGSYFERLLVDPTESFARVRERRGARLHDVGRTLEFNIEHFSGYIVSTGRLPVEIDIEIEIIIQ